MFLDLREQLLDGLVLKLDSVRAKIVRVHVAEKECAEPWCELCGLVVLL